SPSEKTIRRAFSRMHRTRISETRPFGEVMGDAVLSSIQTLLMIGGFIILFSVFTSLLQVIHFMELIQLMMTPLLNLFNIPLEIVPAFITGFFEITMGAEAVSKTTTIPLLWQLMLISFILGFNVFSIQAQVASLIAKTDIRFYPYFISRLFHAITACLLTYIFYNIYFKDNLDIINTMGIDSLIPTFIYELPAIFAKLGPIITIISIFIAIVILIKRIITRH